MDELDALYGPLETALEHSNRDIDMERSRATELASKPHYTPPSIKCQYCSNSFPRIEWFFNVHSPRCHTEALSRTTGNIDVYGDQRVCPYCKRTVHYESFWAHLQGSAKCGEYWSGLSVVEKKLANPDYLTPAQRGVSFSSTSPQKHTVGTELSPSTEAPLPEMEMTRPMVLQKIIPLRESTPIVSSPSSPALDPRPPVKKEDDESLPATKLPMTRMSKCNRCYQKFEIPYARREDGTTYSDWTEHNRTCVPREQSGFSIKASSHCTNCGIEISDPGWFFMKHQRDCRTKAIANGTLKAFDPHTGVRIQRHDTGKLDEASVRPASENAKISMGAPPILPSSHVSTTAAQPIAHPQAPLHISPHSRVGFEAQPMPWLQEWRAKFNIPSGKPFPATATAAPIIPNHQLWAPDLVTPNVGNGSRASANSSSILHHDQDGGPKQSVAPAPSFHNTRTKAGEAGEQNSNVGNAEQPQVHAGVQGHPKKRGRRGRGKKKPGRGMTARIAAANALEGQGLSTAEAHAAAWDGNARPSSSVDLAALREAASTSLKHAHGRPPGMN